MRPFFNVYLISFQNHTIFSCQILLSDYLVRIREAIFFFWNIIIFSAEMTLKILWIFCEIKACVFKGMVNQHKNN